MRIATARRRRPVPALLGVAASVPRILAAFRCAFSLATVAVAALAPATAARAYSEEAIRDAGALLKQTDARFKSGEVLPPDVALARYNLLDMRYKAGRLPRGEFCRAAKAELSAVANAFEDAAAAAGAKQKWLDAIAGMNRSRAMCREAGAAADTLLFGVKPLVYSQALEKTAREFAEEASERFGSGEVAEIDVAQARYDLLALKFAGERIPRAAYCQTGVPGLLAIAAGAAEEARVGQRTTQDVIAAKRRFYGAKAACAGALRGDPKAALALRRSAAGHLAGRRFDAAIADFTALIRVSPQDMDALDGRGRAYAGKQDYDRAIADFDAEIKLDPGNADALGARADSLYRKADFAGAIAGYSALMKLLPNYAAYINRGNAYLVRKEFDRAIADYCEALEHGPTEDIFFRFGPMKDVLASRAYAYANTRDPGRAIADYTELLKIDGNNADAFNGRCWERALSGQFQDALSDCDQSLRLRAGDANTLDSRGFVHLMLGQLDEAVADYDAALTAEPNLAAALYGRGLARTRKGDEAGGAADAAAATALDPAIAEKFAAYGAR